MGGKAGLAASSRTQYTMHMKTEIDTVKITMTIQEAQDFSEQMNSLFSHFAGAVNAVGQTSVEQLMLDYPAVSTFFQMLKITKQGEEMPW